MPMYGAQANVQRMLLMDTYNHVLHYSTVASVIGLLMLIGTLYDVIRTLWEQRDSVDPMAVKGSPIINGYEPSSDRTPAVTVQTRPGTTSITHQGNTDQNNTLHIGYFLSIHRGYFIVFSVLTNIFHECR